MKRWRTVFVDTVGLLALWNRRDQWHTAAVTAFVPLATGPVRLVSTTAVFLECGNAACRTPFRGQVTPTMSRMAAAGDLLVPTDSDVVNAWAAYDRGEANNAGVVDQISFAVMRRLHLTEAFTNDGHFRAAGFITLF